MARCAPSRPVFIPHSVNIHARVPPVGRKLRCATFVVTLYERARIRGVDTPKFAGRVPDNVSLCMYVPGTRYDSMHSVFDPSGIAAGGYRSKIFQRNR